MAADDESPACPSTEGMRELDHLDPSSHQNVPPSPLPDDDDDSDSDCSEGISSSYHPALSPGTSRGRTHFLGQAFDAATDRGAMRTLQRNLYWMTYRNDLSVPLRPYSGTNVPGLVGNLAHGGGLSGVTGEGGMKTDAGWGCMLRSAQMMLAQAVRRHYAPPEGGKGDGARGNGGQRSGSIRHQSNTAPRSNSGSNIEHHRQNWRQFADPHEAERIAAWFADFPNHPDLYHEMDDVVDESGHGAECYGKGGLDHPWYSLHQMVAAGLGLGVLPGEWYGPTTACHVLRELNEIHCARREKVAERIERAKGDGSEGVAEERAKCDVFRVHVATEGCIYLDAISKLMQRSGPDDDASGATEEKTSGDNVAIEDPLTQLNGQIDDPLRAPSPTDNDASEQTSERWDTSLLLLLPLRLGIQSISTKDYGSTLAKMMAFPQSVGMLGGTPRHALWFYGADAVDRARPDGANGEENGDGGEADGAGGWYGLDPHTVQAAPRGTRVPLRTNSSTAIRDGIDDDASDGAMPTYRWKVQLTDAYLRSLHVSSTSSHSNHDRAIPLTGLDPSCALGFYIRDPSDFDRFRRLLEELAEGHCRPNKLPEVVTISETTPNYEIDVSSAMKGMLGKGAEGAEDDMDGFSMHSDDADGAHGEEDDDDDDFVLI